MTDGIEVKDLIFAEICGDCMKKRQQQKLSHYPMCIISKYLYNLHCDLDGPYLITWRCNQSYFSIQDSTTRAYYTKPRRIKSLLFAKLRKFICRTKKQFEKKLDCLLTDFGVNFSKQLFKNSQLRKKLSDSRDRYIL